MHSALASMIPRADEASGFAEMVQYSFDNTLDKHKGQDQLRSMLCLYAACKFEELWISSQFQDLFKNEGEFSCGVITNLLARLE
ncbi:hypothetical protein BKA67DRAFT_415372 [Truncatella angustata]|uniref:Uncharacterized protein n=1 Tax=Truncatella angustata TaxID=152316 RepID=A0A9P8RIN5_9PEZI|nr:uncharacterized protein BKA67DRAFT_415372 [Truncatella angustata]KAH6646749.1 hypothetical protein BKA67DRAFT_415372 [Truncatella angustata]